MGELMRRYWQPVCTSDELADLPKRVKLLCEELVVFRDKRAASVRSSRTAHTGAPRSNGVASKRKGCAAAITAGSTTRRGSASICRARPKSSAGASAKDRLLSEQAHFGSSRVVGCSPK